MPQSIIPNRNEYGDQIDRWKTDLILARAVKLGFAQRELPEIQQEVVPSVAAFRHDPVRYPNASEVTVLTSLIDHHLVKIIRTRSRYQSLKDEVARRTIIAEGARPELDEATDITAWDRSQDVAACMARLDADDRAICEALAAGESLDGIAKRLKLPRRSLQTALRRVRSLFTAMGLNAWMGVA